MSDGVGAYSLGVDLGTTFVAAAIAHGARLEMFTLGDRTVVTPAVVFAREDGSIVTGEAATRRGGGQPGPGRPRVQAPPRRPHAVVARRRPYPVTSLLAALLRDVMAHVTETEGAAPDNVVLTHPANWGPYRRELFDEVPQLAGVPQVRMVTEPEAAAAHYAAARQLGRRRHRRRLRPRRRHLRRHGAAQARGHGRHRHPRRPGGHRAARRRRLRRRHPVLHQLQLGRGAVRAGHGPPADRHRAGPAAPGLHPGQGSALGRHRGDDPGVPAQPAL